jgi:hypothetical protein
MNTQPVYQAAPVLFYFESNARDLLLLRGAAAACGLTYGVMGCSELGEAKDYLGGGGAASFLLVDYAPWAQEGSMLVRWVRSEPTLAGKVIVMCSGQNGEDVAPRCYGAGADYFVAKSGSYARLKQMLRTFDACLNGLPPSFGGVEALPEYRAPAFKVNSERFSSAALKRPSIAAC